MKRIIILLIALILVGCSKQDDNVLKRFSEWSQQIYANEEMDIVTMDYLTENSGDYIDKYVVVKDTIDKVSEVKSEGKYIYYIGEHELMFITDTIPELKRGDEGYFLIRPFESPVGTLLAVHDVGK